MPLVLFMAARFSNNWMQSIQYICAKVGNNFLTNISDCFQYHGFRVCQLSPISLMYLIIHKAHRKYPVMLIWMIFLSNLPDHTFQSPNAESSHPKGMDSAFGVRRSSILLDNSIKWKLSIFGSRQMYSIWWPSTTLSVSLSKWYETTTQLACTADQIVTFFLCISRFYIPFVISVPGICYFWVFANFGTWKTHSSEKLPDVRSQNWTTCCPYNIEKKQLVGQKFVDITGLFLLSCRETCNAAF